jgi:hypothetical protein
MSMILHQFVVLARSISAAMEAAGSTIGPASSRQPLHRHRWHLAVPMAARVVQRVVSGDTDG